ncbi:MAG: fibronectin type III domain-containing protein [Desulfobacterales bacterium]|nr:fibronectin type III domain-containing protein [Desulfobacterales bacterium]
MAQFPQTEAEIIVAAQAIIGGLTGNPTVFPTPPVSAVDLQAVLDSFVGLCDQVNANEVAGKQLTLTKQGGLEELTDAMKADYSYGETATAPSYEQLPLIGWDKRKTPSAPAVPGIPRNFEATRQGEGWVFLDWKSPADGGAVVSYQVERRERPTGDWVIAGMALKSEIMLVSQERGKDLEYRVIPVNNSGQGEPSATIAVVL